MADLKFLDPKDPDDVDDFEVSWAKRLVSGGTIQESWADPIEGDVEVESQTMVGPLQIVRFSGGTPGSTARVRCRIKLVDGRQWDRTVAVRIKER